MRLYKLTDKNDRTYGGCQWGENVTHETSGEGDLCGPGWTHWTTDPLLAVLLNPRQGEYDLRTAHLWEGEGEPLKFDHGLKVGCASGTTIRRIPLPQVSTEQRIRFAILCAQAVIGDRLPAWSAWADGWLSGHDRSRAAAAAEGVAGVAGAARAAAAGAAEWAAEWAAGAAAAGAEGAAEWAAEAAAWAAAWAAEGVAGAARAADAKLDLIALAHRAMEEEGAK